MKVRALFLQPGTTLLLATLFVTVFTWGSCSADETPTWFESLPRDVQRSIIWKADYENGRLDAWTRRGFRYAGSGIFNTGEKDVWARATETAAHSGHWAVETTITSAFRARYGNRAVRLMLWTDRAWDDEGSFLPNRAYFSTWLYFPNRYDPRKEPPWDPGDGGWWNVFQFKSEDINGESQPVWALNLAVAESGQMYFYLYSPVNNPSSYGQTTPLTFEARQWTHIEVFYESRTGKNGRITVFQNGRLILEAKSVVTSLGGKDGTDTHPIWGLGNYTNHIVGDPLGEGRATVIFDDSAVSSRPLGWFARNRN